MSTIDFIYNEATTTIQCNDNDKIEDIIQKFCKKINKNKDSLYFIYGGNRVILPEDLETEDISSVISIFKSDDTKSSYVTKYRDVINKAIVNRNDRTTFVLLGIENQTDVHYAMPIRNMLYDALQYVKQVNMYANYHNEKKDTKTSGEFLLGITKDDKIIPVVTLVIYFGKAEWNGACKLSDMFVETDEEILKYVQDYEIMMINPKQIADGDFDKFSTVYEFQTLRL